MRADSLFREVPDHSRGYICLPEAGPASKEAYSDTILIYEYDSDHSLH
jgi:hypothetical protein